MDKDQDGSVPMLLFDPFNALLGSESCKDIRGLCRPKSAKLPPPFLRGNWELVWENLFCLPVFRFPSIAAPYCPVWHAQDCTFVAERSRELMNLLEEDVVILALLRCP